MFTFQAGRRFDKVGVLVLAMLGAVAARPAAAVGQDKPAKPDKSTKPDKSAKPVPADTALPAEKEPAADAGGGGTGLSAADRELIAKYKSIKWVVGPGEGTLGSYAKLKVPAGYQFTGADGAATWAELNQNLSTGQLGMIAPTFDLAKGEDPKWYVVFRFDEIGYVKDDEKDELTDKTADNLLKQFKEGAQQSNAQRRARGFPELTIDGWSQKPFFDEQTKNLTWAIVVGSEGGRSVNYDSRVLGRRGVMNVKMVLDEGQVAATVPTFRKVLGGLTFNPGQSHAEFKSGDKVAEYGLIGLVGGGAVVAAVKWWKPLMKFGIFVVAGIGIAVKKVFSMFRRSPAGT